MGKIFVASDTHFGHDRQFIWGPRGFNSVHEMDEAIIRRWNEVVSWEDEVYLLGDVMLGDNEKGIRKLNQLNGKIWILTGNHDTATRVQMYVNVRPTILHLGYAQVIKYNEYHFYLSHYPTITSNLDNDAPLERHILNIHGHTHNKEKFYNDIPFMYNACLDAHNCYPICLDTVIEDIKNKVKECKNFL